MTSSTLDDLDESDEGDYIDIEVVCLDIIEEDNNKQKGIITDKSQGRAKYQIGDKTGVDYLDIAKEYLIKDVEVVQAGDNSEEGVNAFLVFRSDRTSLEEKD